TVTDGTQPPTTESAVGDLGDAGQVDPPHDSVEAFSNQWFSDPDAFPQVALWGFGLTAIAFGAYAVSRRARRNWVGALVGIIPFMFVLYFWFENVNRLLPPNF
ncbi:MAG: peptidase family protein, partial [Ilumatobacteraceae bacterium]|nr:peptidase family protein [Ilumatobacteraceae bacterium]